MKIIKKTPMNELIDSLNQLSKDSRLSRLFSSLELCGLTLWVLRIKKGGSLEYRLLYGWILAQSAKREPWSTYKLPEEKKLGEFKFSIHRISFQESGQTIFDLIKQLCIGATLGTACQRLKITQLDEYSKFTFAETTQKGLELLVVRPTVFVKHESNYIDRVERLRPISSPNELVPAFIGSLVRLKKTEIFRGIRGLQSSQTDELSKHCLNKLVEETGLNFCSVDSKRLGNLEWLSFPSADRYERAKVSINFDSQSNTAFVRVSEDEFLPGTQVIIRCCLFDDREVCLDQVKEFTVGEQNLSAGFEGQQKVTKFVVTIWVKENNATIANIWYENSFVLLNNINIDVGLIGLTGTLPSKWLRKANSKKIRQRVEQAQTIKQIHHEPLRSIKKYEAPPWISEGEQSYVLASHLFSSASKSVFIESGWRPENPGRLIFLEWLQSITSGSDISKVLIVDPYFDESGITELIARVSAAHAEYVVLTNTQVSGTGDGEDEPKRALNLKEVCQSAKMDQIFSSLKFQLLDLRSKDECGIKNNNTRKNSKTQLFHDRYIICYKRDGNVAGGYHLSNSIQGATAKHPLLITEISRDISLEVEKYIRKKLADNRYRAETLFSSLKHHKQTSEVKNKDKIECSRLVLSKLLKDKSILSLNREELRTYIEKKESLILTENTFEFKDINSAETKRCLRQLTHSLIISTSEEFLRIWIDLCDWLNQVRHNYEYRTVITTFGGHQLSNQLLSFLNRVSDDQNFIAELDAKMERVALMLVSAMALDFSSAVDKSRDLLMQQDWEILSPSTYGNGIRSATKLLASTEPSKLVAIVYNLHQKLLQASEGDPNTCLTKFTISFTLQQLIIDAGSICELDDANKNELFKAMLKGDVPLLRALSAYTIVRNASQGVEPSKVFGTLAVLPKTEQICILAEWSSALRIKKGQSQSPDDNRAEETQLKIFARMRECYPKELPNSDFHQILNRLSGRSEGSYSISITQDFLVPLINDETLSIEQLAIYWIPFSASRLKRLIDEVPQGTDAIFDCQCEWELINVVAWLILNSGVGQQDSQVSNEFASIKKKAWRIVSEPFLRTKNYARWQKASTCLLWLMMLHVTLLRQSTDIGIESSIQLFRPSEPLNELLEETFEENCFPVKEWLWKEVSSLVNLS